MNDPHVKTLYYRIVPGSHVDYEKAPAVIEDTEHFKMYVDGEKVRFDMKVHCSTVNEARKLTDEYLRLWNILISLEHNPGDLNFKYQDADIIDLSPSPIDSQNIRLSVHNTVHAITSMDAVLHLSHNTYPSRPERFCLSPDVEKMYLRYKNYRQGREPLTTMANVCLTLLQASTGSKNKQREKAAEKYRIDKTVLSKLGELCDRGSQAEARKAPKKGSFVPLTEKEKQWIETVIKAIIRRAGEVAYDSKAKLNLLTMSDFPCIP